MAVIRSCSCPRGEYQSSRPRMRTSVPAVIRTPPPALVSVLFTDPFVRDDSITPIEAPPSGSVMVKYTWPDCGRDRSRISPRTHTSSRNVARSALPMASASSVTENVGSGIVPTEGSSNNDMGERYARPCDSGAGWCGQDPGARLTGTSI
jgi:hypothetical protein